MKPETRLTLMRDFVLLLNEELANATLEAKVRKLVDKLFAEKLAMLEAEALLDAPKVERKPLSDEQILNEFCITPNIRQFVSAFKAGVRYAEAAHGIKEQA